MIAARHLTKGDYATSTVLDTLASTFHLLRPKIFGFLELGINTLKDVKDFVEKDTTYSSSSSSSSSYNYGVVII